MSENFFLSILNELNANCFDPQKDDPIKLPDGPGVYIICARDVESLPDTMRQLVYTYVLDKPVIYTGIAGRPTSKKKSLRNRDFKQHFKGNARGSTLRKSLGVLFGLQKSEKDIAKGDGKYRFESHDESKLSDWMLSKLLLHFAETTDTLKTEDLLINHLNPPLNLKDNHNSINKEFRVNLSLLRRSSGS